MKTKYLHPYLSTFSESFPDIEDVRFMPHSCSTHNNHSSSSETYSSIRNMLYSCKCNPHPHLSSIPRATALTPTVKALRYARKKATPAPHLDLQSKHRTPQPRIQSSNHVLTHSLCHTIISAAFNNDEAIRHRSANKISPPASGRKPRRDSSRRKSWTNAIPSST